MSRSSPDVGVLASTFLPVELAVFFVLTGALLLSFALVVASARRRVATMRVSVTALERANEELARSNDDLDELAEFTGGLAARMNDSRQLAFYAQSRLAGLTGGRVRVIVGPEPPERATALESSGRIVGGLLVAGGDSVRWERLRASIVPRLSTALETAMLAEEARKTQLETIAALSHLIESKESYAGSSTERVSNIAVGLAKRLGYSGTELDAIEIGALMHDIGKIGIPESILHKPGPLDNDEWIVMKQHPVLSELVLAEIDLSPIVLQIARSTHERMDGQGYPDGLAGGDIPVPARIVLVADAFAALTTDRPYRRARRPRAAVDEIVANKGTQFCPKVVAALERIYREEPALLGEVTLSVVAV